MKSRRRQRKSRSRRSRRSRRTQRQRRSHSRRTQRRRGGGLSDVLPVTSWGPWLNIPGATLWSPTTQAPLPLANGGLYTAPQSTAPWASRPFPATQYGLAVNAAQTSGIYDVFYHQRPTTDVGNSWSPYVGQAISPQHWSARIPPPSGTAATAP